MKKLCILLVAVLMLSLCACGNEDSGSSRRNRDKNRKEQVQAESVVDFGQMGWAVDTGSSIYYWKYTSGDYDEGALLGNFSVNKPASLVQLDSEGQETVIAEGNGGEFVVTDERIYYQVGDQIRSVGLDGTDDKELMAGQLIAVNETGNWLIIRLDGVFQSYSVENDEFTMLFADCSFEGLHRDVVYYTTAIEYGDPDYENAQRGQVTLHAINVDGTDDRELVTTQPDLYDYYSGNSTASIEQIRFSEDAVYFSYGSIAGSGGFFQGGKIVRVSLDGSDVQVVAGEDDLVDANFGVKEDGSVATTDDQYFVKYEGHLNYFVLDGGLYWMDPITGMSEQLIETEQLQAYANSETLYVTGCEANDQNAIIMVNYCDFDPEQAVGWRDYAVRIKTVVFRLNRENGDLTELYSF